jgi:GTP-sensing pleiotropic transcriptional regulator CodY
MFDIWVKIKCIVNYVLDSRGFGLKPTYIKVKSKIIIFLKMTHRKENDT